jgi:GT2 family glycosyltransferase
VIHLPVASPDVDPVEVRLASALGPKTAAVPAGAEARRVCVDVMPDWHAVRPRRHAARVINNTGTTLLADGTVDRGYLEPDLGQHDESGEVFGWSGAAVLLARRFLEDVGHFDARLFLYHEDTDLSWRGRLRGWTYRYEPASVVYHEHSATTCGNVALINHLLRRNHLLVLTKSAPLQLVKVANVALVRDSGRAFIHDFARRCSPVIVR